MVQNTDQDHMPNNVQLNFETQKSECDLQEATHLMSNTVVTDRRCKGKGHRRRGHGGLEDL